MERVAFRAGRCQVGSVTGLTESGSVRSSILDTLDTPLTPPPVCEFVSMLCLSVRTAPSAKHFQRWRYGVVWGGRRSAND